MKIDYYHPFGEEVCYHVYNRAVTDSFLFKEEEDYSFFLQKFKEYLGAYLVLYAYALIPNHFHFLVKCRSVDTAFKEAMRKEGTIKADAFIDGEIEYNDFIVDQFKRFFNSYSYVKNRKYQRSGSLFKRKFPRISISDREHFRFILFYLHHNGIHHGLGKNYMDWKYTSYHDYLNGNNLLVAIDPGFSVFETKNDQSRIDAFVQFHEKNKNGLGGYPNLSKLKDKTIDFDSFDY